MSKNNDSFTPWNNPMNDSPFAPYNGFDSDNPFKPWNELFGREEDLTDDEAEYYNNRGNLFNSPNYDTD